MKMYNIIRTELEIEKKKLISLLKYEDDKIHTLISKSIDDTDPETIKEKLKEKPRRTKTALSISDHGHFVRICCDGIIEGYEADEEGEYISGADYDWCNVDVDDSVDIFFNENFSETHYFEYLGEKQYFDSFSELAAYFDHEECRTLFDLDFTLEREAQGMTYPICKKL